MSQKIIVRQILAAGLIILCFSLIFLMLKADPLVRGQADIDAFSEQLIAIYLLLVSVPVGYSLTIYYSFIKRSYSTFIRWFWGLLLILHLIGQILLFYPSSPLHWLAALASIYLIINHFVYLK